MMSDTTHTLLHASTELDITSQIKTLVPNPSTHGDHLKSIFGSSPKVQVEMIPHPLKLAKGGEDAFFVSTNEHGLAFGVADGVGGWGHQGIDPSLVSKGLMLGAKHAFEKLGILDPIELMDYGHKQVEHITGSSTALVLVITEGGKKLTAANLGDSGFMVIRDGKLFFRSEEMQHFFNFPYQLGTGHTTSAHDSQLIQLDLMEGDVIVAGSDALFDNLFDEEIVKIVQEAGPNENVAQILALAVFNRGYTSHPSPFMRVAHRLGLIESEKGGKPDDITVVVTRISWTNESE
jgi:protein phosphatase PTC7